MKSSINYLMFFVLFVFSACQDDSDVMSDADLILAIQTAADKQPVIDAALPSNDTNILTSDFSESYMEEAQLAPELGYEVAMRRGEGVRIGERSRVYFDLSGRELRAERNGNGGYGYDSDRDRVRGEDGRDRRECFRLIFPVTFEMPDGTDITGDHEEGIRTAIRQWYADNRNTDVRPQLQYPVEIIFADHSTLTVNNDEEMREAYEGCE